MYYFAQFHFTLFYYCFNLEYIYNPFAHCFILFQTLKQHFNFLTWLYVPCHTQTYTQNIMCFLIFDSVTLRMLHLSDSEINLEYYILVTHPVHFPFHIYYLSNPVTLWLGYTLEIYYTFFHLLSVTLWLGYILGIYYTLSNFWLGYTLSHLELHWYYYSLSNCWFSHTWHPVHFPFLSIAYLFR